MIPNHKIIFDNGFSIIHSPMEYISKNTIANKLSKIISTDECKMDQLKNLIIDHIYYDYICKKNISNISESKLKILYKCFNIKALKIIGNDKNILCNVLIPIKFINKEILHKSNTVNDLLFL